MFFTNFLSFISEKYFLGLEQRYYDKLKALKGPLVLWGAGACGARTLTLLREKGIFPCCFCESDEGRSGQIYMGLEIKTYCRIKKEYDEPTFMITFANYEKLQEELRSRGERVFLHRHNSVAGDEFDYKFFKSHMEDFTCARDSLQDERSKEVFDNLILYRLTCDDYYTKLIFGGGGDQYFPKDIITLSDREVFADVGAYRGETSWEFINRVRGKYDSVYIFEPDLNNINIIKSSPLYENRVILVDKGAWDDRGVLKFLANGKLSARMITGHEKYDGREITKVKVDKIDNWLLEKGATFMKLDVEGSELQALSGAKETIKRHKPKMAVSVYHRREDLYSIPLYLKSLVPSYRFYLRHHTPYQSESVLYAL